MAANKETDTVIIVEGPDGGGKSTLVAEIEKFFGIERRPRAVKSSVEGVVDNVTDWVDKDMEWHLSRIHTHIPGAYSWLTLYDRHPMISEHIYGPLLRGKIPWTARQFDAWTKVLTQAGVFVIFCMPPKDVVLENVQKNLDDQMPGVYANIETIYAMYRMTEALWVAGDFTMAIADYDYTSPVRGDTDDLLTFLEQYNEIYTRLLNTMSRPERLN